jgi:hypothetical protein
MGGLGIVVLHFFLCPGGTGGSGASGGSGGFFIFFLTLPPARSPATNCGYLCLHPEEATFRSN